MIKRIISAWGISNNGSDVQGRIEREKHCG